MSDIQERQTLNWRPGRTVELHNKELRYRTLENEFRLRCVARTPDS
ncbi:6408_t:CDS:2 [Rhizophagus irregularis]|nr:6408_t:CDS:2 [Rhizophagus irregularis]